MEKQKTQTDSLEEYLNKICQFDEMIISLEKQIESMIREVEELRVKIAGN